MILVDARLAGSHGWALRVLPASSSRLVVVLQLKECENFNSNFIYNDSELQ